jgi:hypothetical protein
MASFFHLTKSKPVCDSATAFSAAANYLEEEPKPRRTSGRLRGCSAASGVQLEGITMNHFFNELAFSARAMRRLPVFTLTAAVTIALGIGASAAMFRGFPLLESLGIRSAEELGVPMRYT